ncbi:MAG TPA: class III lanthionine synthetase LanKC, partial [Symbiobacteriaceae bacterium]|nr:class III lanthionine synthetase LanKC [Symbiobacteriaceae bacterium]
MDAERAKLIQVAGLLHPEFYESLDRYQPLSDLLNQVEQVLPAGWRVMRSGLWHQVQAPAAQVPVQGWKIHLSATYANLEAILQIVLTVCLDHHVPFKFACDKRMFLLINRKFWGRGASGKFITIYPKDEAQFRLLLDELYTRLKGFEGPYILSDRRYKDCKVLYYRYGGLKGLMRTNYQGVSEAVLLTPEGQEIPDAREPQFTVPPWVADPFPEEEAADDTELLNGRYAIQNALHFSNSGGVYEALDVTTGEVVVIKEARPHTNSDEHGNDQIKLMQKEWRLLNRLKETGITPRPIDLFWEWEHLFLVESFAKGVPARRYAAQNSAILKLNATQNDMHEYLRSVEIVGIKVARALQTMHDHGIIFGDVSLANIMINPEDLAVTLIDLEGACEVGVDEDTCLYTPGFTTRDRASRFAPTFEDDDYALGSVLLGLLMPIQVLKELKPDAHQVFLTEIQKDFGLSAELAAVIRGLLNEEASTRMRLPDVIALLDKTQIQAKMPAAPVTFTTESVQQTLRGVGEYMLSAADLKRTNRPFPVDPGNRLPLELGHGALGVIYALHRLHGEVPGEIMDWLLRQEFQPDRYPAGLYTGLSGVAWVLAELGQIDRALDAHRMAANHMHLFTAADLFNGTSGFGLGSLHLWQRTGRQQFLDQALRVGD